MLSEKEGESGIILKHYTPAEAGLVEEWTDKWLELIDLINGVTSTEESHGAESQPDETNELRYASLRSWFLSRQEEFVPLLSDFLSTMKGPDLQPESGVDDCPERYLKILTSTFTSPRICTGWHNRWGSRVVPTYGNHSERIAGMLRPVLIDMGKRMIEFSEWIDDHV